MYLKPNTKKKEFYSEAKRRQERRNQAHSLHCDPKEHEKEKDEEHMVLRMNTEYSEEKAQSRNPTKSKYQRFRGQNRMLNKVGNQRP